jgi:hypothetical protein
MAGFKQGPQEEADKKQRLVQEIMERNIALYKEVGLLASDWAMLEFMVNECIWRVANVAPVLGACITAQVFTLDGRLKALISLLRLRGFDEKKLVKRVNTFSEEVRSALEKRNRAIHDPMVVSLETQEIRRLEVTSQKRPKFETVPISLEELGKDRSLILKFCNQVADFRSEIEETLPTLPEIPLKESLPINLSLILQQKNQANEK